MTITKTLLAFSFCVLSTLSIAEEVQDTGSLNIDIPVLADGQIFSQFSDSYPAMVNYFTLNSFEEVTQFYSNQFGTPLSEQTVYGRLELTFEHMQQQIRVIVAKQENHQEVDIIIEK